MSSALRRWALVVAAAAVQVISGSVYSMGAWQSKLRDGLHLTTADVSSIGAATFCGSVVAMLGGRAFDTLGPRYACALGGIMNTVGYLIIAAVLALADSLPAAARLALPAIGCALAGYSSVSLLDNVVCMACSLSFPHDRAAIVGYLKAVLAAAAGLWALLWVHVFAPHLGLIAYLLFVAAVAFGGTMLALLGVRVLPEGPDRRKFDGADGSRLGCAIGFIIAEALFCVAVSYAYSTAMIGPTAWLGALGVGIALLPLTLLPAAADEPAAGLSEPMLAAADAPSAPPASAPKPRVRIEGRVSVLQFVYELLTRARVHPAAEPPAAAAPLVAAPAALAVMRGLGAAPPPAGVPFGAALSGLDFWLLFFMQLSVFGGGVAANQNLALIFESARSPASSGLGVALFALASTVSRVSVGVLSDQYAHVLSRFGWLSAVCATATLGQLLLSPMVAGFILSGTFCLGLSFGSFFTLIVPVVNEMYGRRDFGVIMGASLGCQVRGQAVGVAGHGTGRGLMTDGGWLMTDG